MARPRGPAARAPVTLSSGVRLRTAAHRTTPTALHGGSPRQVPWLAAGYSLVSLGTSVVCSAPAHRPAWDLFGPAGFSPRGLRALVGEALGAAGRARPCSRSVSRPRSRPLPRDPVRPRPAFGYRRCRDADPFGALPYLRIRIPGNVAVDRSRQLPARAPDLLATRAFAIAICGLRSSVHPGTNRSRRARGSAVGDGPEPAAPGPTAVSGPPARSRAPAPGPRSPSSADSNW
jgi:hypothetical protein